MTNKDIWLYLKSKGGGGGESTNAFKVFNATVKNNEITITGLVDTTTVGNIEIPAKIGSMSVTAISSYGFENCTKLEFIKIPNSVTNIGERAFRRCSSLISVEIPNSVTIIRNSIFSGCTKLEFIKIPNSVTSIESDAFFGCDSLTYVEIPNSVTSINDYAFRGCTNLTNVVLKNNFNCNALNLSASNKYSKETIVAMLNALADRTGETAYTLKLGTTNLAKLTDEDIAIATNKNWTLA